MSNLIRDFSIALSKESGQDQEVLEYGLETLVTAVLDLFFVLLVAAIFKVFDETLVALIIAIFFRLSSGGSHATSATRCCLISIFVFVSIGFLTKMLLFYPDLYIYILIFTLLFSFFVTYKYVPADNPSKPINSIQHKNVLRKIAYIFLSGFTVISIFYLGSDAKMHTMPIYAATLGLLWQFYSVTPSGYKTVSYIDQIIKNISLPFFK